MNKMACLVLAAGQGSRFGFKKQLATIDQEPMINKVLMELKPIFNNDLFVVVGAFKSEIIAKIGCLASPIINDGWSKGLGSSISVGVKKISNDSKYGSVLVTLADQIDLKKIDYEILISSFDGDRIVAAKYKNVLGVPAIFPFSYFEKLEYLRGEEGAKSILNDENNDILEAKLVGSLKDIDTSEDLKNYLNSYSKKN